MTTQQFDSSALQQQLEQAGTDKLPPVNDWNPALSGDIDIFINRRGEWFHEGSRFERPALVKLFASILRRDPDGAHYLLTPVEKWRIRVEDAPFVITELQVSGSGAEQSLTVTTNLGDQFAINTDHPLWLTEDPLSDEPTPYVRVRDRLDALLSRPVYYQLAELAQAHQLDGQPCFGVFSQGAFFKLSDAE